MGRIATLTRFFPASARRCLQFFKMLRSKNNFDWNPKCEQAFQELKGLLASSLVLSKPDPGQI
jgi:hypothetical protein